MATPVYRVIVNAFTNAAGGDFSVGDVVADFENVKNIGYGTYVNDVGELFFTINQKDPKARLLNTYGTIGAHVRVFRDTDNVWSGWIGDADEAPRDGIIYGYSYEAGLFENQSSWGQAWVAAQINTIVSDLWTRATQTRVIAGNSAPSRMGWMTSGTVETPVTTSGGATPYTLDYTIYDKRILFAYQELAAAAISDTTNRVVFEITPAGVFNLWKNRGTDLTDLKFIYGDPRILAYRRQRTPADTRNVIYGIGSTPRDLTLQSTQSSSVDLPLQGRREESVYMSWIRDQAELDRVTKLRLARALRKDSSISFTHAPGALVPFRATGQSFKLTDGVHCIIDNGMTQTDEIKIITGMQVAVVRGQEIVRPLLWDRL